MGTNKAAMSMLKKNIENKKLVTVAKGRKALSPFLLSTGKGSIFTHLTKSPSE